MNIIVIVSFCFAVFFAGALCACKLIRWLVTETLDNPNGKVAQFYEKHLRRFE